MAEFVIKDFMQNVIIIDDKPDEVKGLERLLKRNDIACEVLTPKAIKAASFKRPRQIIFLDLYLSESATEIKGNISEIRGLLKMLTGNFGAYGIILWTRHSEDIDEVKRKISEDRSENRYNTPIFILGLDKGKYSEQKSYKILLDDIDKQIALEPTTYFFLNWFTTVKKASTNAITGIYNMISDYNEQKTKLLYLLYKIARNHTGLPKDKITDYNLTVDALKAFDEMLYSDLIGMQKDGVKDIFADMPVSYHTKEPDINICAEINAKLFLDTVNLDKNVIVPGNVYRYLGKDKIQCEPNNSLSVAIELTPPCDFSNNKKVNSKLVRGFMYDIRENEFRNVKEKYKNDFYYKELYPIKMNDENKRIVFDFRYINTVPDKTLRNTKKYKLLFRVTSKLFSDILQKFSSYSARLGVSMLHE